MSTSPASSHTRAASPVGWFLIATAASTAALVASSAATAELDTGWVGVAVVLAVVAAGAALARRYGRTSLAAFVGGSAVTLAGAYLALLTMTQFYVGGILD